MRNYARQNQHFLKGPTNRYQRVSEKAHDVGYMLRNCGVATSNEFNHIYGSTKDLGTHMIQFIEELDSWISESEEAKKAREENVVSGLSIYPVNFPRYTQFDEFGRSVPEVRYPHLEQIAHTVQLVIGYLDSIEQSCLIEKDRDNTIRKFYHLIN